MQLSSLPLDFSSSLPDRFYQLWTPYLVWLILGTDLLIGLSYVSVSISIYALVRRSKLRFHAGFLVLGFFIFASGSTHFMQIYTLWNPTRTLITIVKLISALASVSIAYALYRLQSKLVAFAELAQVSDLRGRELELAYRDMEKRVEERTSALTQSESEFHQLANSIPQLAWIAHADGTIFWYNDRYFSFTGATPEQVIGTGWHAFHEPQELGRVVERWKNSVATGDLFEMEFQLKDKTGQFKWFLTRITPLKNHAGQIVRWFGTSTDIDEQRRNREQLQESEKKFRQAILNAPIPVLIHAENNEIIAMNRAWTAQSGYSIEDIPDIRTWKARAYGAIEGRSRVNQSTTQGADQLREPVRIGEFDIQTKSGEMKTWELNAGPIGKLPDGRQLIMSTAADVTEQKRLRETEKFLSDVTAALVSSLDYNQTISHLSRLIVPRLADSCYIHLLKTDGSIDSIHFETSNSEQRVLLEELGPYLSEERSRTALRITLNTKEPQLIYYRKNEDYQSVSLHNPRQLELMLLIRPSSVISVPLLFGDKLLGAITLFGSRDRRSYLDPDMKLAVEIARRAANALEHSMLYEMAQTAIRARDEFLSIASHELKTPITALKMQIQITNRNMKLEDGKSPSAARLAKMLNISGIQVDRLTKLVEDLLDVSRIRSGKIRFDFETLNFSKFIEQVFDNYIDQLHAAGCRLRYFIEPDLFGLGDPSRIEQVLVNLITNVMKYAPGTAVQVHARRTREHLEIVVQDEGPGIPKDKLATVFERFERAVSSRNISGLGLGLFIVRQIIEAHHGDIHVESELKVGSKFIITLPLLPTTEVVT